MPALLAPVLHAAVVHDKRPWYFLERPLFHTLCPWANRTVTLATLAN
jgi:hypothetical protein